MKRALDFPIAVLLAVAFSFAPGTSRADQVSDAFDAALGSPNGFAFCSALDAASTIHATRNGAVEKNPLWRSSVNEHHYAPLILGNLALVGLAYAFRDDIPKPLFGVVNFIRCGIAIRNMRY